MRQKNSWNKLNNPLSLLVLCIVLLLVLYTLFFINGEIPREKCHKGIFKKYALVISFDEPYFKDNAMIKQLYSDVFGKVIICGPEADAHSGRFVADIEYEVERGLFGYNCMVLAIQKFGNFSGYFYSNYDMALNWWNFKSYDLSNIWVLKRHHSQYDFTALTKTMNDNNENCRNFQTFLQRMSGNKILKSYWLKYKSNQDPGRSSCLSRPSRFFYLPHKFANDFAMLGNAGVVNRLTQDFGVANIMQALEHSSNYEQIPESLILPRKTSKKKNTNKRNSVSNELWSMYDHQMYVIHPFRLYNKDKTIWDYNKKMLEKHYSAASHRYLRC